MFYTNNIFLKTCDLEPQVAKVVDALAKALTLIKSCVVWVLIGMYKVALDSV